jgi:malate/lactate dehydrogenase
MRTSIGIIGTGWVGSSVAISALHAGVADELLLHDVREEVAEGDAMDLAHGAPFYPPAHVRTSTIEGIRECGAIVVTAGRGGRLGETRLDLLRDNAAIVRGIAAKLAGFSGILVMVTNPVDVLTAVMTEASGLPRSHVIGTGTMLDTARLRQILGQELRVDRAPCTRRSWVNMATPRWCSGPTRTSAGGACATGRDGRRRTRRTSPVACAPPRTRSSSARARRITPSAWSRPRC